MLTTIDEPITVAGVYEGTSFLPAVFKWKNGKFKVEEITLVSDLQDGGVRKRVYSVVSGDTLYRLCFDREQESWRLVAIAN